MSSSGSSSKKSPRGRKSPNEPKKLSQQSDTSGHNQQNSNKPQPTQTPNQNNAPQQPGMFQRVAETAAGVAVGSAVGNLVTSAVSGLFGSSSTPDKPTEGKNECEREKMNFDHCLKEGDLAKCEELQKEFKECRAKYNLP